ncbi:MAG: hypothetical protein ABIO96_00270 [Nitrospiraceae bacterium]
MQILNRETVLRTGDETFANEKIEVTMLRADEPDLKEEATSYQLPPKARTCLKERPATGRMTGWLLGFFGLFRLFG